MTQVSSREAGDRVDWWAVNAVLMRFVQDLIAAELKVLRPGGWSKMAAHPWAPSLDIAQDLGADSLERLSVATALAEAIHLSESGIQDHLLERTTLCDWATIAQTGLRNYSRCITFRTSGSTGNPKACTHTLEALEQEIAELAPHFHGCSRIVSAVPSHHIYGFLFTVLLPRRLGIAEVPILDVRASSPASLQPALRAGDLVVGHPEFWRNVARVGIRIPADVTGVTSTGPLPKGVSGELITMGLARLLEIYGSSETCGVGWRDEGMRAYRLFSYWSRSDSPSHPILRRLPDGSHGSYSLQDHLEWLSADEFLPTGRIDQAVQVGGINVFPGRVRDALLQHPLVGDAAVRLMRSDEGNRLKAFIVPKSDDTDLVALRAQIEQWAAGHLSAHEIPRGISFGSALPRDAGGKLADWIMDSL